MMNKVLILLTLFFCFSCSSPGIVQRKGRQYNTKFSLSQTDSLIIDAYHYSAFSRGHSNFAPPYDSLELDISIEEMLRRSIESCNLSVSTLYNSPEFYDLIDNRIRYQRLKRYLKRKEIDGNRLMPIINYHVLTGKERESGGFPAFSSPTGNDFYSIGQEVYVAVYMDGEFVYLNNAIRSDLKIVPTGTPITHEFPQEVLDTLMQMALEPLLRQMEKGR